jgi:hypothetical protein
LLADEHASYLGYGCFIGGGHYADLNQHGGLREIIIPVPRFDVQQDFADRVEMVNSVKSQHSAATAKAKAAFDALLARASF